jgi:uncharacterized protein (DUF58 family)
MPEPNYSAPYSGPTPPVIPPPLPSAPLPRSSQLPPITSARRRFLFSADELSRFENLLLFAKSTVEGYFAGKHKSPYRGSSVEFTDYKEYIPGDDLKRLDWRAYGRSRRLYVRQYEAETDMVIYLLVDVSASMNYAGGDGRSKYAMAGKIAAALAYLMIQQGDKAALALFAHTLKDYIPPGGTRTHLHNLIAELESAQPASTTGMASALAECCTLFRRRGLLVVISDFWDDTDEVFDALSRFLHRKFEVLLLQVVHPDEMDLPAVPVARFQDMEVHAEIEVEPAEIRAAYRNLARQRTETLAREANLRRMTHALVPTNRPYMDAIEAYLGFRGTNKIFAH